MEEDKTQAMLITLCILGLIEIMLLLYISFVLGIEKL